MGRVRTLVAGDRSAEHITEAEWVALAAGESTGEAAGHARLAHLARCAECRDVLRAVRALREDAAVLDPVGVRGGSRVPRWLAPAGAAALVLVGVGAWLLMASRPAPVTSPALSSTVAVADAPIPPATEPAAPADPRTRPDWLRAVPPAIALYSPGVLTMRGGGDATFADAFAEAIAPWQAGNYADAALRLDALAAAYPAMAEAHFYRGTAWLLADVPDAAVGPLEQAVAAAPAALRTQALWYLGLAHLNLDELDAATRTFTAACASGAESACRALAYLGAGPAPAS